MRMENHYVWQEVLEVDQYGPNSFGLHVMSRSGRAYWVRTSNRELALRAREGSWVKIDTRTWRPVEVRP